MADGMKSDDGEPRAETARKLETVDRLATLDLAPPEIGVRTTGPVNDFRLRLPFPPVTRTVTIEALLQRTKRGQAVVLTMPGTPRKRLRFQEKKPKASRLPRIFGSLQIDIPGDVRPDPGTYDIIFEFEFFHEASKTWKPAPSIEKVPQGRTDLVVLTTGETVLVVHG